MSWILIKSGSSSAEISERGAYIGNLTIDGLPLLKASHDNVMTHGGSAVLIPFAGRIRGGTYVYEHKTYSLPKNDDGNAIHGLLKDSDLSLKRRTESTAILEGRISDSGYPTVLNVMIGYEVSEKKFSVRCEVTNIGELRAPLSVGFHPYFLASDWSIKHDCQIQKLRTSDGVFPNGSTEPFSFDRIGEADKRSFDDCFHFPCDAVLTANSRKLMIRKRNLPYTVVYNGEWAEGKSVAFEPYSSAPDAFNNGIGLLNLSSRETYECGFEVQLID